MKKIVLSTIAITTLIMAGGDSLDLKYNDTNNAEIEALKVQMADMQNKLIELENKKAPVVEAVKPEGVVVKSHVPVIDFSGTHYLGFVSNKPTNGERTNDFETQRNYLQAQAYFQENPKDYMRITLDTHDQTGESQVWLKYAYLYLDDILPNTGVEIGQAHRPWIDYEEHAGWNYRSISRTFVEDPNGADLTNSADRGVDFKTKTEYVSSEVGLFNGEGYHNQEDGKGLSKEWRLTGHLLGTGKDKTEKSATYANLSFLGQQNALSNKFGNKDLNWMGLHAVYNQSQFLASAQYIDVSDGIVTKKGKGFSVNGEYRITPKWNTIARYDNFKLDDDTQRKQAIAGITYAYNKNVEFIANYLGEGGSNLGYRNDAMMLTADVEW